MRSPLKSPPPRNPGQSGEARRNEVIEDGMLHYFLFPALFWMLAALDLYAVMFNLPRMPGVYAAGALAATVFGVFGFLRVRTKARAMKLGHEGEREVGHMLSALNIPGARVFHDIPADGFNLDHVVICDRGIYVIETKTWSKPAKGPTPRLVTRDGRIYRDGKPVQGDPVQQAMSEARWLSERLRQMTGRDFPFQPVVATPGWYVDEPLDAGTKAKAWVLNPKRLLGYIKNDPSRLSPEDVHLAADRLALHLQGEA